MPRPTLNLEPFKGLITTQFHDGLTSEDIAIKLTDEYNTPCATRTIKRRLSEWGTAKRVRVKETAALRIQIANMFYMNFPDHIIVRSLQQEGYTIGLTTIVRIRKAQGCKRWMSVWERAEANQKLQDIVKEELDKGTIEGYGKELLQKYFCIKGHTTSQYIYSRTYIYKANIYRDSLFSIVKQLDLIRLERRTKDLNRKKGEYIVPSPDFIWSIDGHDKLSQWGFQIYACIDAYSRNIIQIYIGISNRTAQSILYQYLLTIRDLGYRPYIIRSDRGKETLLSAKVHFALSCTIEDNPNPDLKVRDCWFFGSSIGNQRIESWWSQIEKSQLY